jgi:hypothetical protein
MSSQKPIFNLRLSPETLADLKVRAAQLRRSATSLATEFIEQGLNPGGDLPPHVKTAIQDLAHLNNRTFNQEVEARLLASLEYEDEMAQPSVSNERLKKIEAQFAEWQDTLKKMQKRIDEIDDSGKLSLKPSKRK